MTSFLQTPEGDLDISTGRLVLLKGTAEKAQKVKNRFRLFEGEYFLDTRVGMPWFSVVFVKSPDLEIVRRLFRRVILSVPGIVEVDEVNVDFNRKARTLAYEWSATDDTGEIISGSSDDEPFIVGGS